MHFHCPMSWRTGSAGMNLINRQIREKGRICVHHFGRFSTQSYSQLKPRWVLYKEQFKFYSLLWHPASGGHLEWTKSIRSRILIHGFQFEWPVAEAWSRHSLQDSPRIYDPPRNWCPLSPTTTLGGVLFSLPMLWLSTYILFLLLSINKATAALVNTTVDDNNPAITYSSGWSSHVVDAGADDGFDGFFDGTFTSTNSGGATATFIFTGMTSHTPSLSINV